MKSVLGISHPDNFKKEGHRKTLPVNGHGCGEWRSLATEFYSRVNCSLHIIQTQKSRNKSNNKLPVVPSPPLNLFEKVK